MAASNEPPESAELDALYDRFLLRRCVQQLSPAGLRALLEAPPPAAELAGSGDGLAGSGGGRAESEAGQSCQSSPPRAPLFAAKDLEAFRSEASSGVVVGDEVKALLEDLRAWVQGSRDGYVSDRRLLRSMQLLRVAAHACGRTEARGRPACERATVS